MMRPLLIQQLFRIEDIGNLVGQLQGLGFS